MHLILSLTLVDYSQLAVSFMAIVAGVLTVVRYTIKKYTVNLHKRTTVHPVVVELKENQALLFDSAEKQHEKLDLVLAGVTDARTVREEESKVIQAIQKKLDEGVNNNIREHGAIFERLDRFSDEQVEQALNVVKSIAIGDSTPTLLYKTTPGEYGLIWHNKAWTEWTGLEIEDTRAGGDILAVHEDDRVVIEPSVEETGQLKEEIDITYMMVRPKTGEKVGKVWAHGYPIHTANDEAWYYVSRLKMIEPEPNWEHLS